MAVLIQIRLLLPIYYKRIVLLCLENSLFRLLSILTVSLRLPHSCYKRKSLESRQLI